MTEDIQELKKERRAIKERWAYIILAMFTVICVVALGAFNVNYVNDNNHAWCELIRASLPVKPPTLPDNATATQLKQYNNYKLVVHLGQRFGCF